jgi:hypothetical protein
MSVLKDTKRQKVTAPKEFKMKIEMNNEYRVNGYTNRWSVIDEYHGYALLENNTYGDETCYLVVKQYAKVEDKTYTKRNGEKITLPTIMETVCETYDDLHTALEDACLI